MSETTKKKVLFIDRDGTIIIEPPVTYQVDTLEQMEFLPAVLRNLHFIRQKLDFEWALVTNQDGLGTEVYPQENFDIIQAKILLSTKYLSTNPFPMKICQPVNREQPCLPSISRKNMI